MQVKRLHTSCDSQLVASQVNVNFAAKDKSMIAYLKQTSISKEQNVMWVEDTPTWMAPIITFLQDQLQPSDKEEARKLKRWTAHFIFQDGILYKRGLSLPLLRCIDGGQATYVLREIHEGVFGIPHSIVSDSGCQFDNKKVKNLCDELGIKKHFSSPHHPWANGQVEAVNKTIKYTLKRKLDASKSAWVDELPQVMWAIRTTNRTDTGQTPFSKTYGVEDMSPVEVCLPTL
ncbi:uncharacterized protein LOC111377456 [Olea europaea var. sylvestris]|uniref:uncharacterized protein LOC111377456 n=1 Tax=Olea europaea var. sylvestris TaxID=158386 RepID=UPI000C1D1D01|nr:uncharacterized protein LOC111377456 [Olea europaea var. sylvestris]